MLSLIVALAYRYLKNKENEKMEQQLTSAESLMSKTSGGPQMYH